MMKKQRAVVSLAVVRIYGILNNSCRQKARGCRIDVGGNVRLRPGKDGRL